MTVMSHEGNVWIKIYNVKNLSFTGTLIQVQNNSVPIPHHSPTKGGHRRTPRKGPVCSRPQLLLNQSQERVLSHAFLIFSDPLCHPWSACLEGFEGKDHVTKWLESCRVLANYHHSCRWLLEFKGSDSSLDWMQMKNQLAMMVGQEWSANCKHQTNCGFSASLWF